MQRDFWVKNGTLGEMAVQRLKLGVLVEKEHAKGLLG